jgi:hypothetical protein
MGEPQVHNETDVEEIVDPSLTEDNEVATPTRFTIASYGADYPTDGLVKRIAKGDIFIPPFQRGFVWSSAQASRFVESLLLGLPVPGIFLFKEPDTKKLVVVDGQQRLRTLQCFYDGVLLGKEFTLRGVSQELDGLTYKKLQEGDRRRLDDAILHATIFQQDDPKGNRDSIYLVFERLNTGGTALNPQEIRSCVSRGAFNELLKQLATNTDWATIFGQASRRGKDQELILRFLAFYEKPGEYERPMKGFLDSFMEANREAPEKRISEYRALFTRTIEYAAKYLGPKAFRPERNLNAAATEAILVGLTRRLQQGPVTSPSQMSTACATLFADRDFMQSITSATTDKPTVEARLRKATEEFAKIP